MKESYDLDDIAKFKKMNGRMKSDVADSIHHHQRSIDNENLIVDMSSDISREHSFRINYLPFHI